MEKLYNLFKETLKSSVKYTLFNGLPAKAKEDMLSSLEYVGFEYIDSSYTELTDSLKEDILKYNGYLFYSIDVSIYLKFKGSQLEPLYLNDGNSKNYLMEEGTNSVVISMPYKEICSILDTYADGDVDSLLTLFVSESKKCVNNLMSEKIKLTDSVYLTNISYLMNNTETNVFQKLLDDINTKFSDELLKTIQRNISKLIYSEYKDNFSNKINYLYNEFTNVLLKYDLDTKLVTIDFEFKTYSVIDSKKTVILIDSISLEFGKYSFEYDFSAEEYKKINEFIFNKISEKIKQPKYQKTILQINSSDVPVYYVLPLTKEENTGTNIVENKDSKEQNILKKIIGDPNELNVIFNNMFEFCNTGKFVSNKKYLNSYSKFFVMSKVQANIFKIIYAKSSPEEIVLLFGANGIMIESVGSKISEFLEKNNASIYNFTYLKSNPTDTSISLNNLIQTLNGLAPKINWTDLLGFYDGRTTLNSTLKKADKSLKKTETPEVKAIRTKYKLPDSVNILPDYEIIGSWQGIPLLRGSNDRMVLIFGVGSEKPNFYSKETILENPTEFKKYGYKTGGEN